MHQRRSSTKFHRKKQPNSQQNRAARHDWEAIMEMARDAEDYWVLDRARRSLATVLELPEVFVYVVQPGAIWETISDPRIEAAFSIGQPVVFAFMRRDDAFALRDYGQQ